MEKGTIYKLTIQGVLPNINDYINIERANRYAGAKKKKDIEEYILWLIKKQLRGVKINKPVIMAYRWIEPNRRRDKDNIAFAKKFIQDALVKAGVLENDGWKNIMGFSDSFDVDKANPHIEVDIMEVDE